MNESEIIALAREYAEEMIKGKPSEKLPNCLKNSMLEMNTEYVAEVFQWLLRRYCLVKKEVVRKEYNEARRAVREGHRERLDTMIVVNNSRRVLLESLFPEIAKEVEG